MELFNFLARWAHVLFGITWIGMLYYFNFVQGGYFKKASPEGLKDAKAHLAPEALWWFRWGAMFTFLTGALLLVGVQMSFGGLNVWIITGATMGTLMFLNVWLIIWPAQQIALGMKEGDGPAAGAKALLASRTNVLFSGPMLLGMLGGAHDAGLAGGYGAQALSTGAIVALALILLLEVNGIKGKMGPMTTVKGVIHCSVALTVVIAALLAYL